MRLVDFCCHVCCSQKIPPPRPSPLKTGVGCVTTAKVNCYSKPERLWVPGLYQVLAQGIIKESGICLMVMALWESLGRKWHRFLIALESIVIHCLMTSYNSFEGQWILFCLTSGLWDLDWVILWIVILGSGFASKWLLSYALQHCNNSSLMFPD